MRLMQSDLAILNAEQYDVGVHFPGTRPRKAQASTHTEAGPRKKMKTSVTVAETTEHEEEEKKRSRGRPRLDTKDETAAERRRTQIRLAQRAYRNRKENAISTLEKRVQELKETNEEMSNAFMKLHDFAVSSGLLEQLPEFGRQLRSTTEMFLALAKKSAEENDKEHSHSASPEHEAEESSVDALSKRVHQDAVPSSHVSTRQTPAAPAQLYGGFMVSHESVTHADMVEPMLSTTYQTQEDSMNTTNTDLGYEIVTVPTLENASFPFGLNPDSPFGDIFSHNPSHHSPLHTPLLPIPNTYAYQESTFGRRLQRVALEKGLQLITMPNPPKEAFAKVFGFCILFEPIEKIKERLRAGLKKSKEESMHYWQFPFLQLGGAGSHVPGFSSTTTPPNMSPFQSGEDGHRIGSSGTIERFKHPNASSGFGIGPFTEAVSEARDKRIGSRMRINLPGFQGDFYDSDEVELYLQERGVSIGAAQDFVTVEVDMNLFDDEADGQSLMLSHSTTPPPANIFGSSSADLGGFTGMHGLDASNGFGAQNMHSTGSLSSSSLSPHQSPGSSSDDTTILTMPDASATGNWPSSMLLPTTTAATVDDPMANMFATSGAGAFGDSNFFAFSGLDANQGSKRIVTIDVNRFIQELVERTTCLGRSPGFRPKDVNTAFWIATRNG